MLTSRKYNLKCDILNEFELFRGYRLIQILLKFEGNQIDNLMVMKTNIFAGLNYYKEKEKQNLFK